MAAVPLARDPSPAPAARLRRWGLLAAYLRPQWPKVLALAVLLVGGIGLQLAGPQILRAFIDAATAGAPTPALTAAAGLFLAVALAQQAATVGAAYVGEDVGWTATNALREDLTAHCLRLDLAFHHAHPPGELIERLDGDVNALANFLSQFVLLVVANGLLLAGVLLLLSREDARVGLALAGFSLVTLLVLGRLQRRTVPLARAAGQANAALFAFLEERLGGLEDLCARGAGAYVLRRFHERARERFARGRRLQVAATLPVNAALVLFVAGNALALGLGAALYLAGSMTLGTVYLLAAYATLLNGPLRQLTDQWQDLQKATASVQRLAELAQERSAVAAPDRGAGGGTRLPAGALAVECDALSFAYGPAGGAGGAAPAVLRDVNLRLAAGGVLGLLGRTGSGKTTLARLLVRLYDPTGGAVRLGGVDLRGAPPEEVRRRVGLVTQEVHLFHATVRDNLTLFDPAVSDDALRRVLGDLGLGGWLRSLPDGLETRLAPGTGGLSAGEAQLLAFARVFLRDPGLVVLDEAASRLDPATERLADRALRRLLDGRTAVVIAHRLATVQHADELLILEAGRVVERGRRTALAATPDSRFARLLRTGLEEGTA